MIILKTLAAFLKTNVIKTIWFNWKMLPANQAYKLPIYLYGKTKFRSLSGSIIIDAPISSGMIKIGKRDYYTATSIPLCIWTIRGTIVFKGRVHFMMGSYVMVSDNATLTLGKSFLLFGSNLKLICFDRISIGDGTRITWDCQIMDTSFHYIENMDDGNTPALTSPISIGDRVWIGNRTTIMRGSIIPNDTIIASNSLINKDYSCFGPFCLLAGCPATIKRTSVRWVYDSKKEQVLDTVYHYTRTYL